MLVHAKAGYWMWITILPAAWFVGMVTSHIVFRRCALNEIARRLKALKKVIEFKLQTEATAISEKRGPTNVKPAMHVVPDKILDTDHVVLPDLEINVIKPKSTI
jgi:hypothetical protein